MQDYAPQIDDRENARYINMVKLDSVICIYRSLTKKGPWAVHITLCSDKGVGGYL